MFFGRKKKVHEKLFGKKQHLMQLKNQALKAKEHPQRKPRSYYGCRAKVLVWLRELGASLMAEAAGSSGAVSEPGVAAAAE